tara:strand:- start:725 stop:1186 length:462 start_codon:yes stop_codon:yes gene_type:complete
MKNKIFNYDFLVVGAGLIGALTALRLIQSNYKVLVVDKKRWPQKDNRTLAVNANSKDFLVQLGLWKKLKSHPEPINKIVISDSVNTTPLVFENEDESMGSVIFNYELLSLAQDALMKKKNYFIILTCPLLIFLKAKLFKLKKKNIALSIQFYA